MNDSIFSAVESGNLDELRSLVDEHGGDINAVRSRYTWQLQTQIEVPLLVMAAGLSHFDIANFLLDRSASVEVGNKQQDTALHYVAAAENGKNDSAAVGLAKRLLEAGIPVDAEGEGGATPLLCFAQNSHGSVEMLNVLLEAGANIHAANRQNGISVLGQAVTSRSSKMVKALIQAGADANDPSSPILAAHSLEMLQILMEAGANIHAETRDGHRVTALHKAVERGNESMAMKLIQAGAKVNVADQLTGQTILSIASGMHRNIKVVRELLAMGADPNFAGEKQNSTPLIEASRYGDVEILALLLNAGADVNAIVQNRTALFQAKDEAVSLSLIEAGADVTKVLNKSHLTPFFRAIQKGWCKMARAILIKQQKQGAEFLNRTDQKGDSALHMACCVNEELVDMLLEAGADPNVVNNNGETPLHIAARHENAHMVLALLETKADTAIRNGHGASALFTANSPAVRQALEKAGAPCHVPTKFLQSGFFPMADLNREFEEGEMPRSKVELSIMDMAGAIRDKPDWWVKISNQDLVNKWRQEAVGDDENGDEEEKKERELRLKQFDYAVGECKWLASRFDGPSRPAAVDGVFCRDDLDDGFRRELLEEIAVLRNRPAIGWDREDRHPGTPQMVDLIHPSMYCFEEGKTNVLKQKGAEVLEAPEWDQFLGTSGNVEMAKDESRPMLQWLPSELYVQSNDDGSHECFIKSYINSLHPEFLSLYKGVSKLFGHALPLLEDVLAEVVLRPSNLYVPSSVRERSLRVPTEYWWWEDKESEEDEEFEDEEDRTFIQPEIPIFEGVEYTAERIDVSLLDRPLQVIVKIASLELDSHERYEGGTWHIEGTPQECIVATACCYLDSVNVKGGDLGFRTAVREPEYEQGDDYGIEMMYGLADGEPLVQPRGSCSTGAGRILAWPNTLQHRVGPVELEDPEKPGKRTICCFFLVDPTVRVRSTATVPPQQKAWKDGTTESILRSLVSESAVRQKIASEDLDSWHFLTYAQACERRERLMAERSAGNGNEEEGFERHFSLCEH